MFEYIFYFCTSFLSVAQLVEQLTLNQWVTGSNPVGETFWDDFELVQNCPFLLEFV